jgi:hypothetical protein
MDVIDRMAKDGVEPDGSTYDIAQPRRSLRAYVRKIFGE